VCNARTAQRADFDAIAVSGAIDLQVRQGSTQALDSAPTTTSCR
jgi:hypothetical protein